MSNPLVACILLTADRPEMTARAVRCFEAQTYKRKSLFIFDSGKLSVAFDTKHLCLNMPEANSESIGALRNRANDMALSYLKPDLFAHWDSDDWSHPNRLAEQVALIGDGGPLDAVGYTDMLFWDSSGRIQPHHTEDTEVHRHSAIMRDVQMEGEAWLYSVTGSSSYLLGTSFLYRRAAWERKPFEDTSYGEDRRWLAGLRTKGVASFVHDDQENHDEPHMIASIHGGNASSRIDPAAENWRRAPEWDAHCRATMALPVPALK